MSGENGEGIGITPFPESEKVNFTPVPQPVEVPNGSEVIPDFIPDAEFIQRKETASLQALSEKYSSTVLTSASSKALSNKTKEVLHEVADFAKENKYKLVVPTLITPIILQQIAEGYSLPVALVKGLDELMRGDPASHMDPTQAKEIVHTLSHAEFRDFGRVAVEQLTDLLDDYRVGVHEILIFAGAVKGMEWFKDLFKERQEAIKRGTAKVKPQGEQFFVLGGKGGSYISEALKKDNPRGVTAVYEDDDAGSSIASLLPEEADKLHPLFLNLGIDENHPTYSGAPGWNLLEIRKNNLVHTKDGRNVLCVVGIDAANEDEWLGIPRDDHDLTLDEHYTSVLKLQW